MGKAIRISIIVLPLIFIASCVSISDRDAAAWLDSRSGAPAMDITGRWDGGSSYGGGWGEANFIQEGKVFSGTLGMYGASGVVIGERVFMILRSGGRIYYTAILKRKGPDVLTGKAARERFVDSPKAKYAEGYLVRLKKMD